MKKVNNIIFEMQYRDAGNWKTSHKTTFQDSTGEFTAEQITKIFHKNVGDFGEPIMAQFYNLESIAPIDNEFKYAEGDDHCFMEVLDIRKEENCEYDPRANEIRDWVKHVEGLTPEIIQAKREDQKAEAAHDYKEYADYLKDMAI